MEIKYSFQGEELNVVMKGELDECTAPYVRLSLDTILKDLSGGDAKLVLDLGGVSFMDSTGIGVLLGRYNKFRKNNVNIYIKNPQGHVNRILEMTGIYEIMPKIS